MFYELTLVIETFLQKYFHVRQEMKLSIEYLTIVKDMKLAVNRHNPKHKYVFYMSVCGCVRMCALMCARVYLLLLFQLTPGTNNHLLLWLSS